MSCLDNTDILRIVGGNSFQIAITVKARRVSDGSEIEDFDLSASSPVLNLIHAGEKTRKYFVTQGNQAIISFDGSEGLGYYGMEMSGSYDSEAWRFCIEKVLQLVDTNAKANIPEWSFLVDDTYFIEGTISIYGGGGGGDTVQADWTETNPTSAAFILHKPDLSVYATKTEVASGLAGKQDTIEDLSTIRSGAAAGATAYQKPSSGIPESDMSEGVQTSLGKADSSYQKPSSGIPSTDMSEGVQAALEKANSAVQTETDPVFSNSPAAEISQNDINSWNAKQPAIADLADIREGAEAGATAVQPDEMAQAIDGVEGDISDINAKIPTAASNLNQLADKAYVNSSIATNSATYRGSFNLITDLGMNVDATHAQIAGALATAIVTADNNDYAFVQIPDSASTPAVIAKIERYKQNGSGWVYEYDLNNSGFTAAQWAAINSGITSGLVGKLADLPNNSELATLLNGKQNVINDLSAIRSGAAAGATAVQPADLTEALNGVEDEIAGLDESKQDTIEDLSTIRSGAAAGATAYQKPGTGIPESDMSDGVQTSLGKADSAYQKPANGIPATDMSESVQESLEKANSAVQTETDPVFSGSPAAEITQEDINTWNAKQPAIADLADIREGAAAGATAVQPDEMAQAIDGVEGDISDINAKIPTAASNLNQLADKAYVNSSIATNSATYRGSFNLITDLGMNVDATHAQIAGALATAIVTADNNDYAFVQIPDSASTPTVIAKIERYKHNGSGWVYEYDLNNSGFTAAQWAAINSGITSGLVGKLSDLPNNSELATLLNGKQNTINDLSSIRSGAAAGATAVQPADLTDALNDVEAEIAGLDDSKQDNIEDLSTIRSGAAAGATAIQPADLTEALSDLPTADNEDIHINSSNKYQLMNRGTSDGMGYIIVRKGSSLSSQMNQTNTIYEIRYDFDLGNSTLTVPNECVLKFEGGSLSNGTLNLNNCYLEGSPLITCEISGNIKNSKYYATWFGVKADGVTDDYIAFQKAVSINKDNILSIEDIKNNIMLSESVSFNIGSSQHKKHLVGNGTFGLKPLTDYDVSSGALLSIEESSYIIDNVPFYGYPDDKTQTALKLEGRCQDIIIRACLFIYFDTAIEYSTNSCYNHIEDCNIYYAKYGFKIPDRDSSSKWCGAIDINNTKINECEYGVYLSGYFSSVCFKGGYLEGCKYKLYVSSSYTTNSSALFTNNYWADESAECIIIGGGTITIETPSSAIAGAYTVDHVDVDKTNKHYTAIVNGGKMKLLNAFLSNSVNGEKANSAAISVGENGLVDIINVRYASGRSYGTSVIDFPAEKNIKFLETIPSYTLNGTFAEGKSPFTTNINGAGLYNGYTIRCGVEVLEDSNGYGGNVIRLAKSDTSYFAAAIPFHVPHLGRYAIRYKIRRNIKNSPCINFSGGTTASDLTGLYYLSSKTWYGYSVLPADLSGTDIMAEGCIPIDVTDEFGYICINNYMSSAAAADTYFDVYYLCLVDSSNDTKIANFADAFEKSGKGTTAKRPVLTGIGTDFQYLDEDLGKPIWWNGTNWVDATGSSV